MKKTKTRLYLVNPLIKAVDALTLEISAELRRVMLYDGWEFTDVASAQVTHLPKKLAAKTNLEKFQAKYEDSDSAFSKEYGRQQGTPQATVRKFMANSKPWEKRVSKIFERKAFK